MRRIVIRNGTMVDAVLGETQADLLIEGDIIAAIGRIDPVAEAQNIDAHGLCVAPGLVDLGVFAVDPEACAAGGITRVAPMPDGTPVMDNAALVQRAALAAKHKLWVHPIAAATKGLEGTDLAELGLMQAAGARAVATGRGWIADSGVMARVLAYASGLGLPVIAHAEDAGLSGNAPATSGLTATLLGLPAGPAIAEAMAVARDIMLADLTGARLHFRQLTTRAALDLVRAARARDLPISCGITPAHLLLSEPAVSDYRTFARLSPPLRSEDDRRACLEALADGTISVLCSGHDPRPPEAKRLPFNEAEPGASGAETLLALGLGLVRDGTLSLPQLIDRLALAPARLLGCGSGRLAVGAPADICLFNADSPWIVRGEHFLARAGNTPFEGLPVQGKVTHTLKGGKILSANRAAS